MISHLDAIIFEGNRRLQIMSESSDIMEQTINLATLIRRRETIQSELNWFEEREKEDCPYHLTGGVMNKRNEVDLLFNKMLFRISEYIVEEYLLKIKELRSETSKRNYTVKCFEKLKLAKDSLSISMDNFKEIEAGINILVCKVEDTFSVI